MFGKLDIFSQKLKISECIALPQLVMTFKLAKNISINHPLVGYAYITSFTPVVLGIETIPVWVGLGRVGCR